MLCAKFRAEEAQVRAVPAPEFTKTWHPISHADLLDKVEDELKKRRWPIRNKRFALLENGARMFGVLVLQPRDKDADHSLSIGVRNSVDKFLSAGVCLGTTVFVCDNLAFSGEVTLVKKHTSTIDADLPEMIDQALTLFDEKFQTEERFVDQWKDQRVDIGVASSFILQSVKQEALPLRSTVKVHDAFQTPVKMYERLTVWKLLNAFTAQMHTRKTNPFDLSWESMKLMQLFKDSWPLVGA